MDEDQFEILRNIFRFLAELRQEGLTGDQILHEIDHLIRGDALLDSAQEIYLGLQQGELFSVPGPSHDGHFHDGFSKDGKNRLRASTVFPANPDRQNLFFFVMRMREAKEHEKIAAAMGNNFAAYGWSCRARAYEEVCAKLKASGFGRK